MAEENVRVGNVLVSVPSPTDVLHDETLSGNGVTTTLGVNIGKVGSELIVVEEVVIGTYTVGTSDVLIEKTISKTGYKPIALTVKLGYSGLINFNNESTTFDNNSVYIHGFARAITGSATTTFTAIVTWIKTV